MKKLLEVKKKIGTLSKNSKNPFFKSQYLDLHSLLENVEPLLQEQGLILLQPIVGNEVHSVIYDAEDGNELVCSSIALPNESNPQKLGMAITYFRRYTLTSLLAISETDDDGNGASKINIEKYLKGCETLDGLKQAYSNLSKSDQTKYKSLKDELKTKLK